MRHLPTILAGLMAALAAGCDAVVGASLVCVGDAGCEPTASTTTDAGGAPPVPTKGCERDADCAAGEVCEGGACAKCMSSSRCQPGQVCQGGACGPCTASSQCPAGEVCASGVCAPCTHSTQCDGGRICSSGACVGCTASALCEAGQVCEAGACGPCTSASQCPAGQVCASGACGPCTQSSQCPGGKVCVAGTCGPCTAQTQCAAPQVCYQGGCNAGPSCPPAGAKDCSPGPGTGEGNECFASQSCFLSAVQGAVNRVIHAGHPWVDWSDGQPKITDDVAYRQAVVNDLLGRDLCAIGDPNAGDEIVVKKNNDFSENFDILTSAGYARYGGGIYTSTCAPAWF